MKTRWWMTGCTLQANSQEETQNEAQNETQNETQNEATNGHKVVNPCVMPKTQAIHTNALQEFADEFSTCTGKVESQKKDGEHMTLAEIWNTLTVLLNQKNLRERDEREGKSRDETRILSHFADRMLENMEPEKRQFYTDLTQTLSNNVKRKK